MRKLLVILILICFGLNANSQSIQAHARFFNWDTTANKYAYFSSTRNYFERAMADLNPLWNILLSDSFSRYIPGKSDRFEIRYTDSTDNPGHDRTEMRNRFDTSFFGYRCALMWTVKDPSWQGADLTPFIFQQFQLNSPVGSPHLAVQVYNGKIYVVQNFYNQTTSPTTTTQRAWIVGNWVGGTTYDFCFAVKFRNDASGNFKFYINGQLATGQPATPAYGPPIAGAPSVTMDINGANYSTYPNGAIASKPIIHFGIYKWRNKDRPQPSKTVLYIDNVFILDSTVDYTQYFYKYNPIVSAGSDQTLLLPPNQTYQTAHVVSTIQSGSGTSPYTYLWSKIGGPASYQIVSQTNSQTDLNLLTVGTYQFEIRVTDNLGNIGRDTVQITINQQPNNSPNANAGADTSITLPASTINLNASASTDDNGIQSYAWAKVSGPASGTITNPNSAITTVTGLSIAGTYIYSVTVTDIFGSQGVDTKQLIINPAIPPVNQPPVANAGGNSSITLPVNTAPLNGSGSTDPDGTITAYRWDIISQPVGSNAVITNPNISVTTLNVVLAGNYNVRLKVTDNNGDTGISNKTVVVSPEIIPPLVVNLTGTNILCFGGSTGAVSSSVSGGKTPYSYLWSNSATTSSISSVPANNYTLTVTDANNSKLTTPITLTQPSALSASASFGVITVPAGVTTVSVSASGGVPPYTGTGTFTNQDTGSHTYPITDANGCTFNLTIFIPLTPTPLNLTMTPINPTCAGYSTGSITTNVGGGIAPYIYIWTSDYGVLGPDIDSTFSAIQNIPAGTYHVKIFDSHGDSIVSTSAIVDPPILQAYESHTNISNQGGTSQVTITKTGGTGSVTGTGTFTRTAGTWVFYITDSNGCTSSVTAIIPDGVAPPPVSAKKYKIRKAH